MIKKRYAFTYDDWPHFFDYEERRQHFYNKMHESMFHSKKTRARIKLHHERIARHCYWMMGQQIPNWKSYRLHHQNLRYGEGFKNSCVLVELKDEKSQ